MRGFRESIRDGRSEAAKRKQARLEKPPAIILASFHLLSAATQERLASTLAYRELPPV